MRWTEERRTIRTDGRHLLAALGGTADEVAASLAAEGVRGKPRSTDGCAIAVYLAAVMGADRRVRSLKVDGRYVRIKLETWWHPAVMLRLPPAVCEFILSFDANRFPSPVWASLSEPPKGRAAKVQVHSSHPQ